MIETKVRAGIAQAEACPNWPYAPIAAPKSDAIIPFAFSPTGDGREYQDIRILDSGMFRLPVKRILVVKLDHFGDFVIGLPALTALRATYPGADIRLICGRWNERNAIASGVVDEVRGFNFFPEKPYSQNSETDPLSVFDQAADGHFDLAIDLRVDDDTRHLLGRVKSRLRCGIGSATRFPFLNIALPHEHEVRANGQGNQIWFFPPGQFYSTLPSKGPLHHWGPLAAGSLIGGSGSSLPLGELVVEFGLTVRGHIPGPRPSAVTFQIVQGDVVRASKTYGRAGILRLRAGRVALTFENLDDRTAVDFRAHVTGRPLPGTVQFSGVTVHQAKSAPAARYRPAELHVGEKLSLLVALIRERTGDLYPSAFPPAASAESVGLRPIRIAVAPFSNSKIRDWPPEYYSCLISLLLDQLPCEVTLLGTPEQTAAAGKIKAAVNSPHLIDNVGQTSWTDLQIILRQSDLVICNNSGIAHQAAAIGARLLAIYSASHQPQEWGPRGMHVRTLMQKMPCSPCGFERLPECTAEHACMRLITPECVFAEVCDLLGHFLGDEQLDVGGSVFLQPLPGDRLAVADEFGRDS